MPKRTNALGITSGDAIPGIIPPIAPDDSNHAMRIVAFPSAPVRRRFVVERPAPPPVRRECPYCGAAFDDYTRRSTTTYCRPSCRVQMSRVKAKTGIAALAAAAGVPPSAIEDVYDAKGLAEIVRLLSAFGLAWDASAKGWRRHANA